MMLRLSPLASLRSARIPYEQVVWSDQPPPVERFAGKIVVVGNTLPDVDVHDVISGFDQEQRWGVELQADAIGTLLRGSWPWPNGESGTVVLTAAMTLLGWRLRRRGGRTASAYVVVGVAAGWIGFALAVYLCGDMLLALPYPLIAFLLGYLAAGRPVAVRYRHP
jgi:CHASE2 domain-containing sensor protein